jgi:hypothetical protein
MTIKRSSASSKSAVSALLVLDGALALGASFLLQGSDSMVADRREQTAMLGLARQRKDLVRFASDTIASSTSSETGRSRLRSASRFAAAAH